MSRTRNYCFTINNYTDEELTQLKKELKGIHYIIVGDEVGESGTPHLQGFIIYNNGRSKTAVIKGMPRRAHVEVCNGTPYENYEYCSKEKVIFEHGERPEKVGQGKRQDLKEIKDKVSKQEKIKTLLDTDSIVNYQQLKFAEGLKKYYETKRTAKTDVIWYHGKPGTGKTHRAREICIERAGDEDNIYEAMATGQWWEGYDGQEYVIIDDLRGDFMKFHEFIKLLDKYPFRVQTKGSSRQFNAKVIIITSPYRPEQIYNTIECIDQLIDRIDFIKEFKGINWRQKNKQDRLEELIKIYG